MHPREEASVWRELGSRGSVEYVWRSWKGTACRPGIYPHRALLAPAFAGRSGEISLIQSTLEGWLQSV